MQDAFIWASQSHLSAEMLAPLRDLNLRFLDLVAARAGAWSGARPLSLPPGAVARIAPLTRVQRAAAANCPYALFDLNLGDEAHWRLGLDAHTDEAVADGPPIAQDISRFACLALFYAWHIASTPRLGAQLSLGMSKATASVLRAIAIDRLPSLAARQAAHLSARWCSSTLFWDALAASASRDEERSLRKVHLFGLQLAAAALLP
jgi:hypothetical protein